MLAVVSGAFRFVKAETEEKVEGLGGLQLVPEVRSRGPSSGGSDMGGRHSPTTARSYPLWDPGLLRGDTEPQVSEGPGESALCCPQEQSNSVRLWSLSEP